MTGVRIVNAFTAAGLDGNPAGVVLLETPRDEAWMQAVAAEVGLSETAFVQPHFGGFGLRWFSPAVEIPLCGHATLATAHVLWSEGVISSDQPISFATMSGTLTARRDGRDITLDFPAATMWAKEAPAAVRALPGADVRATVLVDDLAGADTWLMELDSEQAVRRYQLDEAALQAAGVGGLVLTARADATPADIVSRCFFPAAGIPEDPVTGAAHCALAVYWAPMFGRDTLVGVQASARGGLVRMRLDGERVHLTGQASVSEQQAITLPDPEGAQPRPR